MAAATPTSYDAYLLDMWKKNGIQNLVLEDNPTWGAIQKDTSWRGDKYHLPLGYGDTSGVGADFNIAQNNKQPTSEAEFQLTAVSFYSLFSIQRQLVRRAKDKGAVVEAIGRQSTSAMNAWKRLNGIYLFGNGGGALGVVSAVSGTTLTLTTAAATARFEKNMFLTSSTTDGTSGSVNAGSNRITAVDIGSRTLTGAVAWTTAIPSLAVNDYVFVDGTFGNVITGFDGWLPSSVTSTAFFGLDRTSHPTRLGGQRVTATGLSPRQAAKRAALEVYKAGGKADWYVLGPEDFNNLTNELESAGNLVNTKMPAGKLNSMSFGISYDAIDMVGPRGKITVSCDYNCPDGVGWMLTKSSWGIYSIGDAPYFDDMGGGRLIKEGSADAYEGRIVGDLQVGCDAPSYNCRVTL